MSTIAVDTDMANYRPELLTPETYSALGTISAAFLYSAVLRPKSGPALPSYVYVPISRPTNGIVAEDAMTLGQWNMCWEWGHIREESFRSKIPRQLAWIERHERTSFRFIGYDSERTRARAMLGAYEPLTSLIPLRVLQRFGLSARRGVWPYMIPFHSRGGAADLPRLKSAFAAHIWPLLSLGSSQSSFSRNESIRLLTHHLDFWLPYVDLLIQRRAEARGRVPFDDDAQRARFDRERKKISPKLEVDLLRPCFGIDAWSGEDEAWEVAKEMVELADQHGRLRSIVDAIRSHRVTDDFSARWSFAKEDFERKLFAKRLKAKVTFVELRDTAPVFAPDVETEVQTNQVWQNLFAMVNQKERQIIICLRAGTTNATEIAKELGYANHSPISKGLDRIREKAERLLK